MEITTLGIDLAKSVLQLHGVDERGRIVLQKKLRRGAVLTFLSKLDPCLIGMEACATSHFWARQIAALGHDVRLIPPSYVKPYVKRQKNDAADAEAICEAVTRPSMRFVPIKTEEQQSVLVLHRSRDLLMRQRTMILNAIRAHMAEFGIVAPQGPRKVIDLVMRLHNGDHTELPDFARFALLALGKQLENLADEIRKIERKLLVWHRQTHASQCLETIPGVGFITATALAASVPDPSVFKSGRQFAAWLGLVPRQNSSGGKDRLGRISKMGNGYLRRLLVVGATSVTRRAATIDTRTGVWVRSLLERKPTRLVTVAIANKTARTAWALLAKKESYNAPSVN
ncbi:IS110 family transposase [Aliiroseovarius sp. S1123]|uniref:IS110 family transposase n=1 Tax=unclassified Aliiroseovarius TaxID=2623558 RepID=UPI001FF20FE5|nr:IS110 family transposase [Aliiroseovarius sp. S1123]MCK0172073.1 IS110 family transposase [Aliiroseovarius sp. S1123]